MAQKEDVLVFDLDGTLIRNDLTHELLVLCARWKPHLLPIALFKFLISKPEAKRYLAEKLHVHYDATSLPYDPDVIALMKAHKAKGVPVEIVSGSDHILVKKVADHLEVDFFKGSEPGNNLTSTRKAAFLRERHGDSFVYVGNSSADYAVWRAARKGYGVNAPSRSYKLKQDDGRDVEVERLVDRRGRLKPLLKAMRLHQWAKNILIFIVPGLVLPTLDTTDFLKLVLAFFCFSLLASATYMLNDLFDMPDDRAHHSKHTRPLASGALSVPLAGLFMAAVIPSTIAVSFLISPAFGITTLVYGIMTCAYSFRLKRLPVLDVFILAALFMIRVIAGANVVGAPPTGWLLTFIGTFFLSLAIGKRYVEVVRTRDKGSVSGRGYVASDEIPLLAMGTAAGFSSVISLLIYGLLSQSQIFHSETTILLGSAILAAWVLRFWMIAGRGELHDDPVIFAVKDKVSLLSLGLIGLIMGMDITRPAWSSLF